MSNSLETSPLLPGSGAQKRYQVSPVPTNTEQMQRQVTRSQVPCREEQESRPLIENPQHIREAFTAPWLPQFLKNKIKLANETTVMLVGKSGVGKSTLLNALFQVDDEKAAKQGFGAGPQTTRCDTFSIKIGDDVLHVIDTPGYYCSGRNTTSKAPSVSFVKTLSENCGKADIILMCFQMDSNADIDDSSPITLITRYFNEAFWKKTIIVFTRANHVKPVGKHAKDYTGQTYFKMVLEKKMAEIKDKLTVAKEKMDIDQVQFAIAGSPGPYDKPTSSTDAFSENGYKHFKVKDLYVLDDIARYDDPEKWVPLFVLQCLASRCTDAGKIVLLKIHTNWKEWSFASGAAAGSSVPMIGGGIVLCCAGAGAGAFPFLGIPIAATMCSIGGALIVCGILTGTAGTALLGKKAHSERVKQDPLKHID